MAVVWPNPLFGCDKELFDNCEQTETINLDHGCDDHDTIQQENYKET